MNNDHTLKIAVVCDWLTGIGGAERIVLELHHLFPDAPIYTSQYDPRKIDWFKNADVRTLWLQRLPTGLKKFLPLLRSWAFSRLDLSQYDVVISVTGAEAKAVKTGPNTTHICYCNAPTHYYWSRYDDYLAHPGFGLFDPLARLGLRLLVGPLRRWDYKAAQRPEVIIANSTHDQANIKKYYDRDSVVIHPPVDISRFEQNKNMARQGFVVTGRQTPYKRIDLAVATCTKLNLPLTVIGNGPEHASLESMAGPTIKFITDANDEQVASYLASAQAFIFPTLDDFGISAVEALAAGTPVIAFEGGGALDYVEPGKTGQFFTPQSVEALSEVLSNFHHEGFNEQTVREAAMAFAPEPFAKSMRALIDKTIAGRGNRA